MQKDGKTWYSLHMKNRSGFALVELLIVIAIIGILAAVVLASLSSSREKARDAERLADLAQIQLALEVYFNENGGFPDKEGRIGPGETDAILDTELGAYLNEVPGDPNGPGDADYYYSYDSSHVCDGGTVVIFANNMEGSTKGNKADVCSNDEDTGDNAYYIILQ